MNINAINTNRSQNFGAVPTKKFLNYAANAIQKTKTVQAVVDEAKVVKNIAEIRGIFADKVIDFDGANVMLGRQYLTTVEHNLPVSENLSKIKKALRGRMAHLRYFEPQNFAKQVDIDATYQRTLNSNLYAKTLKGKK